MMKNSIVQTIKPNKGITLTALVITIILLLVLAGVGISVGKDSIENAKLMSYGTELQAMQNKVNELEQELQRKIKSNDTDEVNRIKNIGQNLKENEQENTAFTGAEISDTSGYRYYDKNTVEELGFKNFNSEFLVNVEKRKVILLYGIEYRGKTIWTAEQLDGNNQYNVEYGGVDSLVTFDLWISDNKLLVKDIRHTGNVKNCTIYYGQGETEANVSWKIAVNNTTETSCKIDIYNDGVWYVKVEDSAGHSLVKNANIQTVTFDANGGNVSTTYKKVIVGQEYGNLPVPTRDGYTFLGWNGKNLYDFGKETDYWKYATSNITFDINEKSISDVKSNGWAGDYWRNEKNCYQAGTYSLSAIFEGDTSPRHIIFLYDSSNNMLTNSEISISNTEWNNFYQGWIVFPPYSIIIPSNVSYWKYGSAFNGKEGKSCKILNIQIEKNTESTQYEPYYIKDATVVTQNHKHKLTAIWQKNE